VLKVETAASGSSRSLSVLKVETAASGSSRSLSVLPAFSSQVRKSVTFSPQVRKSVPDRNRVDSKRSLTWAEIVSK
jgi:hypothetical protein